MTPEQAALEEAARRMRAEWDERAARDAQGFIYTRDRESDEQDFLRSGEVNYDQLVRPFLPVLLEGRAPARCRAVEIGCGVGRMTIPFARQFGSVDAVDVSERMVAEARRRLGPFPNACVHLGNGYDLGFLPDACCDLVFSYIVFQHIPSAEAVENYVREAARVLKPRGAFKFQLNGDQSPEYLAHERDTWLGETFSFGQAETMLARAGFSLLAVEGIGTQFFVLAARKAPKEAPAGPRPFILPGEAWAGAQLKSGWGAAVEESWRPIEPRAEAVLGPGGSRFYLSLYFWPLLFQPLEVRVALNGTSLAPASIPRPGDHFLEFETACSGAEEVEIRIELYPPPDRAPAMRVMGLYELR